MMGIKQHNMKNNFRGCLIVVDCVRFDCVRSSNWVCIWQSLLQTKTWLFDFESDWLRWMMKMIILPFHSILCCIICICLTKYLKKLAQLLWSFIVNRGWNLSSLDLFEEIIKSTMEFHRNPFHLFFKHTFLLEFLFLMSLGSIESTRKTQA